MNVLTDKFWNASLQEWKQGYVFDADNEVYTCLVCEKTFEQGRIYTIDSDFYEAKKAIGYHIADEHGSMFQVLLGLDKEYTGFTEHQKTLLTYFYNGYSDKEILEELGGSASTIRNYRFNFREKEKQAKLLLAILELLRENSPKKEKGDIQRITPLMSEQTAMNDEEYEKIVQQYFPDGPEGRLTLFPKKQKRKLAILQNLSTWFVENRMYTEKEVNEILRKAYDDYVTLRRYLIDYGFLERKDDGSAYWVKPKSHPVVEAVSEGKTPALDRNEKKRRIEEFKQQPKKMGAFCLKNLVNGKVLIGTGRNLDSKKNLLTFALRQGFIDIPELQEDWNQYGPEQFSFEILQEIKDEGQSVSEINKQLKALEAKLIQEWDEKEGLRYS